MLKELGVIVVLRENSMHKAMQEDIVATQTSVYISAKPRTKSFMLPIHCFYSIRITTSTFQYPHYKGIPT